MIVSYISLPNPLLACFSREPWFFYWEIALEANIWAFCVLVATGVLFLLGIFS